MPHPPFLLPFPVRHLGETPSIITVRLMTLRAKTTGSTITNRKSNSVQKDPEAKASALSEEFIHDSDGDEANGIINNTEITGPVQKRRKLQSSRSVTSASPKPFHESSVETAKARSVESRNTSKPLKSRRDSLSDKSPEEESQSDESDESDESDDSDDDGGNYWSGSEGKVNEKQDSRKGHGDHTQSENHDRGIEEISDDSDQRESEGIHRSIREKQPRTQPNLDPTTQPELKPYKPPPGYEVQSSSASSKLASLCSSQTLAGKQIWYITAPASIPLDKINEMNPETVANGKAVLSYKDTDYGFTLGENDAQFRERLLIPNSKDNTYHSANSGISRSMHLRQLVCLPQSLVGEAVTSNGGYQSGNAPKVYTKAVRQQPEGLRMRYKPFGDSDPTSCVESEADVTQRPQFRVPHVPETGQSSQKKRGKVDVANGDRPENYLTPKKQRKKSLSATPNGEVASAKRLNNDSEMLQKVATDEGELERSNAKEKKEKGVSNGTPNQQVRGRDNEKAERKADKARRREKAQRREGKASHKNLQGVPRSQNRALDVESSS